MQLLRQHCGGGQAAGHAADGRQQTLDGGHGEGETEHHTPGNVILALV